MAEREARVLSWLAETPVPAPRLVAVDPNGREAGTPAVLMTRVPGRNRFRRLRLGERFTRLARTLLSIHALAPPDAVRIPPYFRYAQGASIRPPAWSRARDAWAEAIAIASAPPAFVACFIHRDYHPENVLWRGERITGVIDWVAASTGPPEIDVAHFRANLFRVSDRAEADAWISACLRAGVIGDYDPRWDLVVAVDFLPGERMTEADRRAADRLVLAGLGRA